MRRLVRHYLVLSSLLFLLLASCKIPYKGLEKVQKANSAYRFKPEFDRELYRCIVDGKFIFKKFHLSGVLFFKELKNGTIRAIFQNEMGMAFFDMEWKEDGSFELKQIIEQLDKEAVVKTLRKDLEMLLMIGMEENSEILLKEDRGKQHYYRLNRADGYVYYISEDDELKTIENAGKRKKVVTIDVGHKKELTSMPDSLLIKHHKANFTISLTKI